MRLVDITPLTLEKLEDSELLALWNKLSMVWEVEKPNKEEVINRAIFTINEFTRRELEFPQSLLYKAAIEWKQRHQEEYAKVYPSGEKSGREIRLDEVKSFYDKPIKLMDNAISLVGGIVVHEKSVNDFETLVRIPPRDELLRRIMFRLDRAIPDVNLRARQHMLDDFNGPFTDYFPLYDLVLVPAEHNGVQQMSEDEELEQEVRAKNPQARVTAEKAKKDNKIIVLEFFYPLKSSAVTLMGYRTGEKYSVEQMISYLKKVGEVQKKQIMPVFIQKKYDGIHSQIHKKGDIIKIFSDDGTDITSRLPGIVKEIKELNSSNFILDAELEMWDPDHRPREEMAAYLHLKSEPNDSKLVVNIFDILLMEDNDIHEMPYANRIKILDKFGIKQSTIDKPDLEKSQLNLSPTFFGDTEDEIRTGLTKASKSLASEGAMVKFEDFKYSLNGRSNQVLKLKTYAEAHVIVWKVNTTKVSTIFNYDYAVAFTSQDSVDPSSIVEIEGKKYSKAGRSYDTAVKCGIGDIVTIKFHTANLYKDPKTGSIRIHLYEPVFYEKREKTESPDVISTVIENSKSAGILVTKIGKESSTDIKEAVRQPFGSPGGKRYMADRLVRMFPEHKTYVEPFIGGGAVFWKKKPSEKEIINDKDKDIVMAYKTIQNLTEKQWEELKHMEWRASIPGFARVKREMVSATGLKRFHHFIYLKQFSDVAEMNSYDDRDEGKSWAGINNLMRLKERLKDVTILNEDYRVLLSRYDSANTFFYIDPPYPSAALSWKWMPTEEEVESAISKIKGKFLMSYELTKNFNKFHKSSINLWAIANPGQHHQGMDKKEQLICNYKIERNTKYLKESDIESGIDWFNIFHELFVANGYANNWLKLKEDTKLQRINEAFKSFKMEVSDESQADEILGEIRSRGFKNFVKIFEGKVKEQTDPFLRYPDEEGTYKCIFQHHYRGKSVHCDQRSENLADTLIGWTINDQIPKEITEPVTTVEQAKALDKKDIFKINYQTGEWKQRLKKGQTTPVNVSLVTEKKAPEPHEWINVEGVVNPGEVGATKNMPGVFTIVQRGIVEYGAQKSWSHEYFFNAGAINYKIVYRQLKLEFKEDLNTNLIRSVIANNLFDEDLDQRIQEAIENPTKVIEEIDLMMDCEISAADKIIPVGKMGLRPETGQVGWLAIKPIDQTPYVISNEAVNKGWMPPLGYSALPKAIRAKVPDGLKYWNSKDKQEALEKRNALVEQIKKKEVKIIAEAMHSREKCMSCEKPPTVEVKWAEGMGHAWFCDEHFKTWSAEHKDDIDYIKKVKDGIASEKFADNPNPNIKEQIGNFPFVLQHHWWKGQVAVRLGPSTEHWDIRVDTGSPELLHLVLEYNPVEEDTTSFYLKPAKDKSWMQRGKKVERINPGEEGNPTKDTPAWIDMIDSGNTTILEKSDSFMKFKFDGKKLKGLWIAKRESPSSEFWQLNRSELPEPK